jgi:hypothetical protein
MLLAVESFVFLIRLAFNGLFKAFLPIDQNSKSQKKLPPVTENVTI